MRGTMNDTKMNNNMVFALKDLKSNTKMDSASILRGYYELHKIWQVGV